MGSTESFFVKGAYVTTADNAVIGITLVISQAGNGYKTIRIGRKMIGRIILITKFTSNSNVVVIAIQHVIVFLIMFPCLIILLIMFMLVAVYVVTIENFVEKSLSVVLLRNKRAPTEGIDKIAK